MKCPKSESAKAEYQTSYIKNNKERNQQEPGFEPTKVNTKPEPRNCEQGADAQDLKGEKNWSR